MYCYNKLNKRIEELDNMRDENEHFTGSWEQLDELMNLATYGRECLGHALCLDFKTNVKRDKKDRWAWVLKIDNIPCRFTTERDPDDQRIFNYQAKGIARRLDNNEIYKIYDVECRDISCFDCYFIYKEVA